MANGELQFPLRGEALDSLIPHRHPFLLIDAAEGFDGEWFNCRFEIRAGGTFVQGEEFDECGLVEHIAQTAAARAGALRLMGMLDATLGYIASVDGERFARRARVGELLRSRVREIQQLGNLSLVEVEVRVNGGFLASGRMKFFAVE